MVIPLPRDRHHVERVITHTHPSEQWNLEERWPVSLKAFKARIEWLRITFDLWKDPPAPFKVCDGFVGATSIARNCWTLKH